MVKRLSAKIGEYEKDGQTKGRYVEIGVILSSDAGEYVLMDPTVNLAGVLSLQNMMNHKKGNRVSGKIMVGIYSDEERTSGGSGGSQGGGGRSDMDDEIPF